MKEEIFTFIDEYPPPIDPHEFEKYVGIVGAKILTFKMIMIAGRYMWETKYFKETL